MWFLSFIGQGAGVWLLTAAVLWFWPRRPVQFRRTAVLLGLGNLTALAFEYLVKPLIARPRPALILPDARVIFTAHNYSFPSGHALAAFASAAALYHLDRRAGVAALILAALIAFSRVYVGNHWPTDVLAGAVIGWVIGWLLARAGGGMGRHLGKKAASNAGA